jgi:hypothetical protein
LHVLSLSRLKRDDEAIAIANEASAKEIASQQTLLLLEEFKSSQ